MVDSPHKSATEADCCKTKKGCGSLAKTRKCKKPPGEKQKRTRRIFRSSSSKSRGMKSALTPPVPTPKSVVSPMISVRTDPCKEYTELLEKRRNVNREVMDKNKQCEDFLYSTVQKYFNLDNGIKTTYRDLLNALMHLYKENKAKNPEFFMTLHDFIQMFAKSTMEKLKFKRQHVFEAMCKLLLLFNYDNGDLGTNKQFYSSLEELVKNPDMKPQQREDILTQKVNESSRGGVVDILFRTEVKVSTNNCKEGWSCDCENAANTTTATSKPETTAKLIMIQNKYYDLEKTNNKDEYDVAKIYASSQQLQHNREPDLEKQIVLMVNNKNALDSKLTRNKGLIHSIYGVKELEDWFRKMLYDLYSSENVDSYIAEKLGKQTKEHPVLYPRFHQQYFTNTTLSYNKEGYRLFIWGAVPRSGKSYMIGDFITNSNKRLPREQDNDIVIILGAKTETEGQFIKMFCEYSNFDDYGIIVASSTPEKCAGRQLNKHKFKNIYIFSQEWFKTGKINAETNTFIPKSVSENNKFKPLFDKGKIDIYFDEIHKGGSTDKAENILNAFHKADVKIDIFVMVSATFAKPNIRYSSADTIDKDKKRIKVIEWSYEDQQMMKKMETETSKQIMINSKKNTVNDELIETMESVELEKVFHMYKELYGPDYYLTTIAKEYAKHPELVIVSPEVLKTFKTSNDEPIDIRTCFIRNLKCNACASVQTKQQLQDPANIFNDVGRVNDLLQYISGKNTYVIDQTSVYSYLRKIGAPTRDRPHTELWFLPDKDLYANADLCKQDKVCKQIDKEDNQDEEDSEKSALPNIEPLTRGLAFLLMNNEYFKRNYNVLIVQNTKPNYKTQNGIVWKADDIFPESTIQTTLDSKNLSKTIKEFETKTYSQGKSLIVLTGAKLRLGISLPCADIAFNFDDIHSIDNNYQTIFRVLTEREYTPKPYGYYVDFNKDRAITFLYDYNATYGSGKNKMNKRGRTEALQSLMFMFNYNGLGLVNRNTSTELNMYNRLIKELRLDEASYITYMSKTNVIKNNLRKHIGNLSVDVLKELKRIVHIEKVKKNTRKPDIIKTGNPILPNEGNAGEGNDSGEEEHNASVEEHNVGEEDSDFKTLVDNMVETLPSVVALLALFSNKEDFDCATLEQCIIHCISDIDKLVNTVCTCETDNVLVCYLNHVNNENPRYTKALIIRLLGVINDILHNPENDQINVILNNIFSDIKETMVSKNAGLIFSMTPEDIQNKIEEYLQVRSDAKDKFGEVFTPAALIEEMLDKLPKSVWSDPDKKWLDPANGIGNFPMIVYKKLDEGLKKVMPDDTKRRNHIVKNMLYMSEISPRNIKIAKKIFGENANICCCDFLNDAQRNKCFEKWGVNTFDIIMGNPPYNSGGIRAKSTDKRNHNKDAQEDAKTIWPDFVKKSLELLEKDSGYLLFIHPASWIGFKSSNGEMF